MNTFEKGARCLGFVAKGEPRGVILHFKLLQGNLDTLVCFLLAPAAASEQEGQVSDQLKLASKLASLHPLAEVEWYEQRLCLV